MQTKRNKRYVIHYPPGACGDFLMTCLYLLDPGTPDDSWKKHTFIDKNGKVWPGDYQIEVLGFVDQEDELFPKAPRLRNTDFSVEDYIHLNHIINGNELDINAYIDTYDSIYTHVNSEKKHMELAGTHHIFSYNNTKEIRYMFLDWCKKFDFDKNFYVSFENLDEIVNAYCKYYVKDINHNFKVDEMDGRELANTFKYFNNCLKTQQNLSKLGMIGIPYSILSESSHIKIARYLSKYTDVRMSEQYINFVDMYKKRNAASYDISKKIEEQLMNKAKTYITNFQNIQKGMKK